jgi:hypothetical protein
MPRQEYTLKYGGIGGTPYRQKPGAPVASIPDKPPVTMADKANKVIEKQFNK